MFAYKQRLYRNYVWRTQEIFSNGIDELEAHKSELILREQHMLEVLVQKERQHQRDIAEAAAAGKLALLSPTAIKQLEEIMKIAKKVRTNWEVIVSEDPLGELHARCERFLAEVGLSAATAPVRRMINNLKDYVAVFNDRLPHDGEAICSTELLFRLDENDYIIDHLLEMFPDSETDTNAKKSHEEAVRFQKLNEPPTGIIVRSTFLDTCKCSLLTIIMNASDILSDQKRSLSTDVIYDLQDLLLNSLKILLLRDWNNYKRVEMPHQDYIDHGCSTFFVKFQKQYTLSRICEFVNSDQSTTSEWKLRPASDLRTELQGLDDEDENENENGED